MPLSNSVQVQKVCICQIVCKYKNVEIQFEIKLKHNNKTIPIIKITLARTETGAKSKLLQIPESHKMADIQKTVLMGTVYLLLKMLS